MENQRQKEIDKILNKNCDSKQLIDLAINLLESTNMLSIKDELNTVAGLIHDGILGNLTDNLRNVSRTMNEIDSSLVDLQEDMENGQDDKE